ncbi:hypothetical protein [Salinimicrobium xinjiangense]|nr:hypothetical protein [Salinimicrobium xinjiangense]
MSVLIEVIIAAFFSVLMSTEEVKNENSEKADPQEQVAGVSSSEDCD